MKTNISKFIITIFILNSVLLIGQVEKKWNTKVEHYSGGVILSGIIDVAEKKCEKLKPIGKDVSVSFDQLYQIYKIEWSGVDGWKELKLEFVEKNSEGNLFIDLDAKDDKVYYYVDDQILQNHKLYITGTRKVIVQGKEYQRIIMCDDLN